MSTWYSSPLKPCANLPPKVRGAILGVPHNKEYSRLGSLLGSPYFGELLNLLELQSRLPFFPSLHPPPLGGGASHFGGPEET